MDLRKLAAEITARRFAAQSGAITAEVREQLINQCEESLENILDRQILDQMERLGTTAEFEQVLDNDGDAQAFLARVIPNYAEWAEQAVWRAVKEIEEGRQ